MRRGLNPRTGRPRRTYAERMAVRRQRYIDRLMAVKFPASVFEIMNALFDSLFWNRR